MNAPVRILVIDDSEEDAVLLVQEIENGGFHPNFERVWTKDQMLAALDSGQWDIVLSDFSMPSFSGLAALSLVKSTRPDVPFVVVSGTIGEERAAEAMRAGASDCVMKGNLRRIVPVLARELREAEERRASKQIQKALALAEGQFRTLVENSIVGIYVIQDRAFVYANPRLAEILGYSVDELANRPVMDLIHPDDRKIVDENVRRRLQGVTQSIHYVLRMLRKNMSIAEVEVHGSRTEYRGRPAILGILLDISERREQERALKESEARLRQIIDLAPVFIFAKDRDGRFILANRAVARSLGKEPSDVEGKTQYELTRDPAEAERFVAADRDVIDTRIEKFIPEESKTFADGTVHLLETTKIPFVVSETKERAVLGTSIDITARKQAEAEKERLAREIKLLLQSTSEGIYGVDMEGRCTFANPAATKLLGFTSEELHGRDLHELVHHRREDGSPYPAAECPICVATQNGVSCRVLDDVFWRKDHSSFPVEYCASPIIEEGVVKGAVVAFTDCAEKKRLEAQFLRNQRMESIGTLAGGVAHDLNNVLAPILMGLQVLRMRVTDPEGLSLIDTLETSAQRGAGIVKQILSFARGVESERRIVQLRHLILDQAKICKDTFPASIQIQTKIGKELWPVLGDATQLHQVIMNLCVNARDAMPGGGTLTIEARNFLIDEHYAKMHVGAQKGPYVVLTVADTGTGIPAHVIDKIFDPFFTTKPVGQGTGLGLSTVLGIIKGHKGWVTVYSEAVRGAQFMVYLPAALADSRPNTEQEQTDSPKGAGELVLVVDDEQTIREVTKKTLESNGYRVLTASDGTEALARFAQNGQKIALVITDMAMPFLDGPATIRALKKLDPVLRIIAVSGMVDNGKVSEIADTPGLTFLSKPFTAETLLKHMSEVLKSGQSE